MTTFSIVTPSYNQAEFIERTILSVISQQGDFRIQYIVMDGGSTDATVEILKKYESMIATDPAYAHITFIWKSEKDKGQSDAINKGLRLATGDIITYLNSDDTYAPDALQQVATHLMDSKKERCYGKCRIIDKADTEIRKWITGYKNRRCRHYSYPKLLSENFISQMTVFWTKHAFAQIGEFNESEHLCMDYEYWLRLGALYTPVYIDSYLANFRFYHTSKSGARFTRQFSDELRIAKKYGKGHPCALVLHQLNVWKIVTIYKILGRLKK